MNFEILNLIITSDLGEKATVVSLAFDGGCIVKIGSRLENKIKKKEIN